MIMHSQKDKNKYSRIQKKKKRMRVEIEQQNISWHCEGSEIAIEKVSTLKAQNGLPFAMNTQKYEVHEYT